MTAVHGAACGFVVWLAMACGRITSAEPAVSCEEYEVLDGVDNDCDGVVDECESEIILCQCAGKLGLGKCVNGLGIGPCTLDCAAATACGVAKGQQACSAGVVEACIAEPLECTAPLRSCPAQPGHLDCSGGPPGICIPDGLSDGDVCPNPSCLGGRPNLDDDGDGNPDDDGDGLPDCWESEGGIDLDGDGNLDLELPFADPNRKNLYVELDYMPGHRPLPDTLEQIAAAFSAAPTPELPGVTPGIILTFEPRMDALPHADYLALRGAGAEACTGPARAAGLHGADFDELKSVYFGTTLDRALAEPARGRRLLARSFVYRYGIFGHYLENAPDLRLQHDVSGCAEVPGNDLVVTLTASLDATLAPRGASAHDCDSASGTVYAFCQQAQAGALMHELGHTLGLRHAGASDGPGCKPNYVSVMNYAFQFNFAFATRRLDYSHGRHIALDEAALFEAEGLGPWVLEGTTTNFGPSPVILGCGLLTLSSPSFAFEARAYRDGPIPINWDRDCRTESTPLGPQLLEFVDVEPVAVDLNDFGFDECGPSPGERYEDYDDWANLVYDIRHTLEFADGVRTRTVRETLTSETIHRRDSDHDGVSDVADNCPRLANADQLDTDDDAVGDACELPSAHQECRTVGLATERRK